MAMMMTGRVLLVCALCVLWCGAGGRCGEGLVESRAGVSGSGGEHSLASKQLEDSPQDTQGLHGRVPGDKDKLLPASSRPLEEEDDDSDNDEDEGTEDEVKITERQGDQGGTAAPDSDSTETNLIGTEQQTGQLIISAEEIPSSDSRETNANPTQTKIEKKDADKRSPSAENPLTTGNGENTLPESVVGVNPPPPPEDSVDSRKQDGEDTRSEGEKNVPSPETAATPQSHRDEGSEGTGEGTKATTVIANTTDTTNKQNSDGSTVKMNETAPQTAITLTAAQTNHTVTPADSDGSTAVTYTTSPLLTLLVVACAAAVVAACQ
ncbi:mucin-associated surface protein (MASP) [Trypanosoma cruzi Dm28c]|uniref:Mucin-associated surface protein (MASP) n=2 Tax=Trypanosoma cruzi TaxID=5693 RepID=V5BF89_TRYCR|nr:mucin-associated surface protein (MASP) [Trypanosoma cruzi Dm28c]PBJ70890.1 mucin-associated surface protein [Trypanosoma cruzi cruzi]PWV00974.1 Mucin-associated surface protein (MASP) [Trypanosoma cruzi]